MDDWLFDEQLPMSLQLKSSIHFTPLDIARRAARLLAPERGTRVLDVGSGVGKFCIGAAQAFPGATFVGIERRAHLVEVGIRLCARWKLSNVELVHGDAFSLDWSEFDSFYLFNPFGEERFDRDLVLDHTLDLDPQNFRSYVDAVLERLDQAPVGTRVVTYHGFGARPPLGYELAAEQAIGSDKLELWIKQPLEAA